MIPVALYGVDAEMCERFFEDLPGLVTDAYEDRSYIESLYAVQAEQSIEHISIADQWAERVPFAWPEDIVNEVEMVLRTTNYPDVSLLEHLMTLDGVDAQRISEWMHFSTNLFPIYSEKACQTLNRMGLDTPYKPDDIASYGLYVNRIEGLKLHAPAAGLPEIGLPEPGCCSWAWSGLNEQCLVHAKLVIVAAIWGFGWPAGAWLPPNYRPSVLHGFATFWSSPCSSPISSGHPNGRRLHPPSGNRSL